MPSITKTIEVVSYNPRWLEMLETEARNNGYGGQFLNLIEKWLKLQKYKSIYLESSPNSLKFYKML